MHPFCYPQVISRAGMFGWMVLGFNGSYKMESRMPGQEMRTARTLLLGLWLFFTFGLLLSFVLARRFLARPSPTTRRFRF